MKSFGIQLICGFFIWATTIGLATVVLGEESQSHAWVQKKSVAEWAELLQTSEDKEVRRRAAYALGRLGRQSESAIPQLIEALSPRDQELAWYAVDALGRVGSKPKEIVPEILKSLNKRLEFSKTPEGWDDKEFRVAALRAMSKFGPEASEAVPLLEEISKSEDVIDQAEASSALWKIARKPESLQELVKTIQSDDKEGSYAALVAYLESGVPFEQEVPVLLNALGHSNPDVRRTAAKGLGNKGLPAVSLVVKRARQRPAIDHQSVAIVLGYLGNQARQTYLDHPQTSLKNFQQVVSVLKLEAVPTLIALLGSNEKDVRTAAIRSLSQMGPVIIPAVLQAMQSENKDAQQSAKETLIRVESYLPVSLNSAGIDWLKSEIANALIRGLNSPDKQVKLASLRLLAQFDLGAHGKPAVPDLKEALKNTEIELRRYAAKALEYYQ